MALTQSNAEIFSKNYLEKYNLSSTSSTQRAVNKLQDEGIIEKIEMQYQFSDPFFKKYLLLRFKA